MNQVASTVKQLTEMQRISQRGLSKKNAPTKQDTGNFGILNICKGVEWEWGAATRSCEIKSWRWRAEDCQDKLGLRQCEMSIHWCCKQCL